MEWPCGKCEKIAKHPYGHYYGFCENCEVMAEYVVWREREGRRLLLKELLEPKND